jgi:hypothetical protein
MHTARSGQESLAQGTAWHLGGKDAYQGEHRTEVTEVTAGGMRAFGPYEKGMVLRPYLHSSKY